MSTAIVSAHTANQIADVAPASREMAVTTFLVDAHDRLALAVQATGPHAVAALRVEVSTAVEATRQLGLSREIQTDAQEMVRRCEFALDKAIRRGQQEGTVSSDHNAAAVRYGHLDQTSMPSPSEFFGGNAQARSDAFQMGGATEEEFDQALTQARDEGNLSRANVIRKIKGQGSPKRTRAQLADEIDVLASGAHAAAQIARVVGVSEQTVRKVARDFAIDIPADRLLGKTRRINYIRIARATVTTLDGLSATVDRVTDLTGLDHREAQQWTASLDQSIKALHRLNKKIKEAVQ